MDFSSLFSGFKKKKGDAATPAPKAQPKGQNVAPALNQNLFNFGTQQHPGQGTQAQAPQAPAQQDLFPNLNQPSAPAPEIGIPAGPRCST